MRRLIRIGIFVALLVATAGTSRAQQAGSCEQGSAQGLLDANNVRAAVYNGGNLFWRGSGNVYTVPKSGGVNSIFNASLWLGGVVNGEVRFSGTDYGLFEFFPGPLTASGALPNPLDCSKYDRIYEITIRDLERLDATGEVTADILEWPWQHGAPVRDGDGDPDNYDLEGGDRPEITGHQMLWWVMNDLGSVQNWDMTPPLGVEVRASAFAVASTEPPLNDATFYRYVISNPQNYTIDSVYTSLWVGVNLGNKRDDFVGSDTTLGMGFAYNGDEVDENGYGVRPPAFGVDVVQGPRAEADGLDNDGDGHVDENGERLSLTTFMYYNSDSGNQGDPSSSLDMYAYMRGFWLDERPLTHGGTGYSGDTPTRFFYPGDPVTRSFWSEENINGTGARNTPTQRRFIVTTGPFRLLPNETEEIVLAIVWARGTDRLDSVTELRKADRVVQEAWDSGAINQTAIPPAPTDGPTPASPANHVSNQPLDLTLAWEPVDFISDYVVELAANADFNGPSYQTYTTIRTSIEVDSLMPFTDYFWRLRGESPLLDSPVSETVRFRTSDAQRLEVGIQRIPGTTYPAFLEIVGPGGADPCGGSTQLGCLAAGGDLVYDSYNSSSEYVMFRAGRGPETSLPDFAPHDFDIRFTSEGSFGAYAFTSGHVIRVPFEVWDVGPVGLFNENDPADDVRMIPVLQTYSGGECAFGYGEYEEPRPLADWEVSDDVHAYYATTSYEDWEAAVRPLVDAADDACYAAEPDLFEMIDFDRGRPIQDIIFSGNPADQTAPGEGTVIRFYTSPDEMASPLPAAPASGSGPHDQPLTLWWNAQYGSQVAYQLHVASDPSFAVPVVDAITTEPSFIVSGLDEGRIYYWRSRLSRPEGPWSDVWTFTAGEVTNVSNEKPAELPAELTLDQNYPNPFNPSTTIRFGLPEAVRVQIEVYDLLGRRIATLLDDTRAAGWHEVQWDAGRHASGLYVYTIQTEKQRRTRSMVLLR